jgi:formylglycine-generating enzyme required for sulfatase activity/dienelactone hydrolase
MSDDRWRRVKQLFEAAVEQPPSERSRFVLAAVAGDDTLRREVDALLQADAAGAGISNQWPAASASLLEELRLGPATASPDDATFAADEDIGPYRILALLGSGGMGEVFRAQDSKLNREVALKLLPRAYQFEPDRLARFRREAQALAALNHPHIAAIYGLEESGRRQALVLELVEGVTLASRIREGPLAVVEALTLARQIADALQAAHEKGIVHRDLKPANIKVTPAGVVKVLDFGLAKAAGDSAATRISDSPTLPGDTRVGVIVGTAAYMSPEQACGNEVDTRTDIWAFGCVLFEMLAGRRVFEADSASDSIAKVLDGEPDWTQLPKKTPTRVQQLLRRCLQKDRNNRPQNMSEVRAVLEQQLAPRMRADALKLVGVAVALVLVTAGVAAWTLARRAASDRERAAAGDEVERLVNVGRFVDVWQNANTALRRWPGDSRLQDALQAATDTVTIVTEPSGADVLFKAYTAPDGDWIPLGTSPLNAVRAPLGMLRWRLAKPGFEPLEARLEVGAPAAAAGRPDVDAGPIRLHRAGDAPTGTVFVPGGRFMERPLTDFWIDRHEVTNREFKRFIERGGYQNPAFWGELERASPPLFGRLGSAVEFSDTTGRPGPSTWELGSYPEGQDEYPVGGVSWFEAAAYCASDGQVLPTVFHWRRAFGAFFFMEVVTMGNFNGRGPEAVGSVKDLGPFGTYGMAGNVKEWAWNEIGNQHYILGGGWNEPVYMATSDDARPALDRAATNGFRCMREISRSDPSVFAPLVVNRAARRRSPPVTDREFTAIRRFYEYDRTALASRLERAEEHERWRQERVSFAAAYGGERVLANILLPKDVAPPYQAVIWFPGFYARQLSSTEKDLPFSVYFDFIARSGRALVYPVYSDTYERRRSAPPPTIPNPVSNEGRDRVVRWAKDVGRTVDYLESRGDFDASRIAYYGYSMGAAAAPPIIGVEPRLRTAMLLGGGIGLVSLPPETDPATFLPRIRIPVLMLGGRLDFNIPVEVSQKPMFDLIGTPSDQKRFVIFENAGHVPPRNELIREVLDWLDRYLGPVQR